MFKWFTNRSRGAKVAIVTSGSLVLAGIVFGLWFGVGYYSDSWNLLIRWMWHKFVVRQFFPGLFTWTPLTIFFVSLIVAGVAPFAYWRLYKLQPEDKGYRSYETTYGLARRGKRAFVASMALALVSVLGFVTFVVAAWHNDKYEAQAYSAETEFVVEDPSKMPISLQTLVPSERPHEGAPDGCAFRLIHDVPSCVTTGTLPSTWNARLASATGADIRMSSASAAVSNTTVMKDASAYLYNEDGSGAWTAIRNGINRQPAFGAVVLTGGGNQVETCRFDGVNKLNYAFDGNWGQNLDDEIADRFPHLMFEHDDMWSYCEGSGTVDSRKPVIVVPVSKQVAYGFRTVLKPAGVLIITGSPSGDVVIQHKENIKPGELPGPVYPLTITAKQREMVKWAAGRANMNRLNFGFQPIEVASQADNSSEFLLRDPNTKRLFWVTPMSSRGTTSEMVVAYSITPADEVSSGVLNRQKVYVLPDNDKRIVDFARLRARVGDAIRDTAPGFFTGQNPGRITEFLPVDGMTWQAYAEIGGLVKYRIQLSADGESRPILQQLTESGTAETALTCQKDPKSLTVAELVSCLNTLGPLAAELNSRGVK